MKKVVLVYPRFLIQEGPKFNISLSVLHLGTFIESKGYQVKIIDGNVEDDNYERLIAQEAKEALCVGVSAMTDQVFEARRLAKLLKIKSKLKTPIVFGGVHATLFPQQTVEDHLVDFAVVGEGELSFWQLLLALEGQEKLGTLEGVAYLDTKGKVFFKPRTVRFDFQTMPFINYQLLNPRITSQFPDYFIAMITSRGCPHGCTFCINTVVKENRIWRAWPPQRAIAEIKNLQEKFKASKIFFWDENFFVNKKRVEEILNIMENEKIKIEWFANCRADYFREDFLNSIFLKRLKKNGLRKFGIGAESGSSHMLEIYNKGIEPNQIVKSASLCHQASIVPTYSFMIGAPGETDGDVKKTLKVIGKIYAVCPKARILGPQLFRPYPGSILYQRCLASGWREPKNLSQWAKVVSQEFMETNPFKAPWISNQKFVNIIWFYSTLLVLSTKKLVDLFREYCKIYKKNILFEMLGTAGVIIISWLGKLRLKINFYEMPFEVKTFKKFRAILSS